MKKNKLKKKLRALICVMLCLVCFGALTGSVCAEEEETLEDIYNNRQDLDAFTDPEKFAEKFGLIREGDFDPKTIDYFYYNRHFMVTVSENNVYDVTEIVDVYFNASKNGITRTLPRYNTVADINGITTMDYPVYSGIYSDAPVTVTETDTDITIKLGGENSVYNGFKQFRLHYTLDLGPDVIKGRDEAMLYLITPSADKPTMRCQFEIELPKAFDEDQLSVICQGIDQENLTYSVEDMKISGETTYHIDSNKPLAFRVKLPDGYFGSASRHYNTYALISLGAATLMVIVCTAIYMYSRSRNGKVHRLDYFPPKELNPIEAHYLKTGRIDERKLTLFMPYLAGRGCFKVTEFSKGMGKPSRSTRGFIYTKSDEMPMLPKDEKMFIEGLFGKNKRAKDSDELIQLHDNEIRGRLDSTLENIKEYIKSDKTSNYSMMFAKGGLLMRLIYRIVLYVLAAVSIGMPASVIGTGGNEHFSFITFVLTGVCIAGILLSISLLHKAISSAISAAVITGAAFYLLKPDGHIILSENVAIFTAIAAALILNIFTRDIDMVRTPYGKKLYDRLMGFERFMQTSDTGMLQKLCEQDSDYLYKMLPYTKALDISLPRPKKLEKEYLDTPPSWYELTGDAGGFDYSSMIYFYETSADDISYKTSRAAAFDPSQISPKMLERMNRK